MTLLRSFENPEYDPEYSTLALRDFAAPGGAAPRSPPPVAGVLLHENRHDVASTIARSGAGWLEALAADAYHTVHLELHGSTPAASTGDGPWDDVVELPYLSATGWVGLTTVINRDGKPELELGEPGPYAVRVSIRRGGRDGDLWRLAFWQRALARDLPRWVARRRPASFTIESVWTDALGWAVGEVLRPILAAGPAGATLEEMLARAVSGGASTAWPDEPLHEKALTAEIAQLGGPAPGTRRALVAALVGAGILTADDGGGGQTRYRPGPPRPLGQVLRLPADRLAALELRDGRIRHGALAGDLTCLVAWAPAPAVFSVAALAQRLLATIDEVRAALRFAIADGLLTVTGDAADDGAALSLALLPGRDRQARQRPRPQRVKERGPEIAPARPADRPTPPPGDNAPPAGGTILVFSRHQRTSTERPTIDPPTGAPPRAGCIDRRGAVIVWRDGRPITLTPGTGQPPREALETAEGILLFGPERAVSLVRPDGEVTPLGEGALRGVLDETGTQLAFVESHRGRRGWNEVHLIDLARGTRRSYRDDRDEVTDVAAVLANEVVLSGRFSQYLWSPGTDPRPADRAIVQIDHLSGVTLEREPRGAFFVRSGETCAPVTGTPYVALAPGGDRVYTFEWGRPEVTFTDVAGGAPPQRFLLPAGARTETVGPMRSVWESPEHLLFVIDPPSRDLTTVVRLNARTGALERVPVPEPDQGPPLLVVPLLRRGR